jgi:hypothetical protein
LNDGSASAKHKEKRGHDKEVKQKRFCQPDNGNENGQFSGSTGCGNSARNTDQMVERGKDRR